MLSDEMETYIYISHNALTYTTSKHEFLRLEPPKGFWLAKPMDRDHDCGQSTAWSAYIFYSFRLEKGV